MTEKFITGVKHPKLSMGEKMCTGVLAHLKSCLVLGMREDIASIRVAAMNSLFFYYYYFKKKGKHLTHIFKPAAQKIFAISTVSSWDTEIKASKSTSNHRQNTGTNVFTLFLSCVNGQNRILTLKNTDTGSELY